MSNKYNELNDRQRLFVDEYIIQLHGTRAAISAGYSKRSAECQASRLLRNDKISTAISEQQKLIRKRTEITQDMIVSELAKIGFSNMGDYLNPDIDEETGRVNPTIDITKATRDQMAALTDVSVDTLSDKVTIRTKIKLADKRGALELLGKHLGMFNNKIVLTGDQDVPIQIVRRIVDERKDVD